MKVWGKVISHETLLALSASSTVSFCKYCLNVCVHKLLKNQKADFVYTKKPDSVFSMSFLCDRTVFSFTLHVIYRGIFYTMVVF